MRRNARAQPHWIGSVLLDKSETINNNHLLIYHATLPKADLISLLLTYWLDGYTLNMRLRSRDSNLWLRLMILILLMPSDSLTKTVKVRLTLQIYFNLLRVKLLNSVAVAGLFNWQSRISKLLSTDTLTLNAIERMVANLDTLISVLRSPLKIYSMWTQSRRGYHEIWIYSTVMRRCLVRAHGRDILNFGKKYLSVREKARNLGKTYSETLTSIYRKHSKLLMSEIKDHLISKM